MIPSKGSWKSYEVYFFPSKFKIITSSDTWEPFSEGGGGRRQWDPPKNHLYVKWCFLLWIYLLYKWLKFIQIRKDEERNINTISKSSFRKIFLASTIVCSHMMLESIGPFLPQKIECFVSIPQPPLKLTSYVNRPLKIKYYFFHLYHCMYL